MTIIRILLDTCAVRNFLHPIGSKLDSSMIIPRLWKYRISIADGALAELVESLINSSIPFVDWQAKIHDLDCLLDPKWPIFVGGNKLSAIAGFQTDLSINLSNHQIYFQTIWKLLRDSQSLGQILAGIKYTDACGNKKKILIDPVHIKNILDGERRTWIDFIAEMQRQQREGKADFSTLSQIIAYLKSDFGSAPTDAPDLATRLNTVISLQAHFIHLAINTSFNPSTTKRRGDLFDWSLLFALPLPTVIVTSDKPFINRLKGTKAADAFQVISVEEFNDHARNDTLESLIAHHRTPETQCQKWRMDAYFHWVNRGRPCDDALTDWLATEPIA